MTRVLPESTASSETDARDAERLLAWRQNRRSLLGAKASPLAEPQTLQPRDAEKTEKAEHRQMQPHHQATVTDLPETTTDSNLTPESIVMLQSVASIQSSPTLPPVEESTAPKTEARPIADAVAISLPAPLRGFMEKPQTDVPEEAEKPPPVVETARSDPIEEARNRLKANDENARRKFWRGIALLVVLPSLIAAAYEALVAVPLYEARSVVVVSKANSSGDAALGGLLGSMTGAGVGNMSEAFMAHEYILSQSLVNDLEADLGLISRYSGPELDPLKRIHPLEWLGVSKRAQFNRFVHSSVNVQTGMITLYVNAPSPEESTLIAEKILTRVEDRVNELSDDLFVQQITEAQSGVEEARQYLIDRQSELSRLQIESGETNPEIGIANVYESITALQAERLEIESMISSENVSGRERTFETDRLSSLLENIDARIADRRQELVEGRAGEGGRPLNALFLDYQRVQLEMEIGQEMLSLALAALDVARERAALGRSQFQVVVPPLASETPWRPRPVAIALLVFVISLSTLSVLRLFRAR